jgi:hypothetical protein
MAASVWPELREFIRRLTRLEDREWEMKRKVQELQQQVRDLASLPVGGGFRTTTLRLQLRGGLVHRLDPSLAIVAPPTAGKSAFYPPPGTVVQIADHDTGQIYGYADTSTLVAVDLSSYYTFAMPFVLTTSRNPVTLDLRITTNPSTTRFAIGGSQPNTYGPFTPSSSSSPNLDVTGLGSDFSYNSGYSYTGLCDLPTGNTLLIDDTSNGIVGASLPLTTHGFSNYTTSWGTTVSGVQYGYTCYDGTNTILTLKPVATGIPVSYGVSAITSLTAPTDTGVKFSVSIAVSGGTVTVYEP